MNHPQSIDDRRSQAAVLQSRIDALDDEIDTAWNKGEAALTESLLTNQERLIAKLLKVKELLG